MPGERLAFQPRLISMSLDTFQVETNRYSAALQEEESALSRAYELFSGGKSIWPDQCKRIIALIQKIQEPVRALLKLLEYPEQLPKSAISQRYVLLMKLQHVDEQATELPELIMQFRNSCRTPSKRTLKEQQEIQHRLELLLQNYDDTLKNMGFLSDVVRLGERRAEQELVSRRMQLEHSQQSPDELDEEGDVQLKSIDEP